jgi:predicted metal-binding protein
LVFLFFTAALCAGLCQGCDLCHPQKCEPEEANAIEKDGIIYKQIGHGFDLTFASLTCLFIRMREDLKRPTFYC